jgi:hypothetical protein
MSTINLRKCVGQASKAKETKFIWGSYNNFTHGVFGHEQQVESMKESLELEHPWREYSRSCRSVLELKIE